MVCSPAGTWLGLLDIGLADSVQKNFRSVFLERGGRSLERALAVDPTEPLAVAAALNQLRPDGKRCAELTAGVVQAHPGDWRAWRLRAATKLAPADLAEAELTPCSRD